MKTIKKFKIVWAIVCAIVAVVLCIAVYNEWTHQADCKVFSMIACCLIYCAGSVGLFFLGKESAEWIDYWFLNGDIYYKGNKGRKH